MVKRWVPVLQKDDGSITAESLDIIAYFMDLKSSDEQRVPSEQVTLFQSRILLLTHLFAALVELTLLEYQSEASKAAWRASKEILGRT
ncbi:hypothetical protein O9993_06795 [Vibrio lentus]|nr:hypothetical protein [Vibrio lentus]